MQDPVYICAKKYIYVNELPTSAALPALGDVDKWLTNKQKYQRPQEKVKSVGWAMHLTLLATGCPMTSSKYLQKRKRSLGDDARTWRWLITTRDKRVKQNDLEQLCSCISVISRTPHRLEQMEKELLKFATETQEIRSWRLKKSNKNKNFAR